MGDLEVAYNSDQEVSENHSKLIEAVAQLDKKQRVNKAERSEPTLEVSEFHLVKSGTTNKDAVQVGDLVKSLGQKGYQSQIRKKLQSVRQRNKVVSKPLEKPSAEKVKMRFGFERTLKDLSKWNAIVARNRTATNLSFPLRTPRHKLKIDSPADFISGRRLKSDLERKLEELDPKPKEPPPEEENDKKNEPQMTLRELKKKRNEIAKRRAQQSYQEAKMHRQRKIKSKKFHRFERKKREMVQLTEFARILDKNPDEALINLEQLDKNRAEERMSLRHKSTGQWAKNKMIRAKYNKEVRHELAEQLAIGRELIQKATSIAEVFDADKVFLDKNKKKPPNSRKTESKVEVTEVDKFIQDFRTFHDKKKKKSEKEILAKVDSESKSSSNKRTLGELVEELTSDESDKADDTVTSTVTSTSQKTEKSIKDKKASKKSTSCTVTSNEIGSKKKKTKLCNEKNEAKVKNKRNAEATSTWHVEELQCNKKTNSKTPKIVDIDDMFDSVEENIKHKVNLKMQKMKKELETEKKVNKHKEKENKENEDYVPNLEFKDSKQKPVLNLPLEETTSRQNSQQNTDLARLKTIINKQKTTDKSNSHTEEIDLQKCQIKPKYLKTQIPDVDVDGEDMLDNDEPEKNEENCKLMNKALEDNDAEEEFQKEKEEEIKTWQQWQNINMTLPGWGNWAGSNIKESKVKRKKKLFITKLPKDVPRKDENKGDVIIFEGKNQKLKEHLVSELPYPFTSVKDFEASMRAPLGRTFVPENAHRRLIQPSVVTKSGQIIQPMTEDLLLKKQPIMKRNKKKTAGRTKNRIRQ